MRGEIDPQRGMFSYVDLEQRVPQDHPIRKIRRVVDKALKTLDGEFSALYSEFDRSSIAPEMLLRAQFIQITKISLSGPREESDVNAKQ